VLRYDRANPAKGSAMAYRQWNGVMAAFRVGVLTVCGTFLCGGAALAAETLAHVDSSAPHAQPAYPDLAQESGEQGTVLVDVYVRSSGRPGKFRVAQSSGFGDLDNAALGSVLGWRFVPATRDGDTVSSWTTVKIVFQLPQPPPPPPVP